MSRKNKKSNSVQLIPLGGVGEIGKNMFLLQYGDEAILMDAGLKFPDESMLGVDIVIPDISYILDNGLHILGVILTHGHEDHIGALPYILEDLDAPIYGTRLTLGLLEAKLREHPVSNVRLNEISPDEKLILSENFKLEFFRTNHSIPDSVGVAVETQAGVIVYTSDFKFDQTPVDGKITDYHKLAELGRKGVVAALIDCTNADRPGYTLSEKQVGESINEIFRLSQGRIILATFASNIHRIQQVVDAATRYDRKVCVVGRSIVNSVDISTELGYLKIPDGVLIDIDKIKDIKPEKMALITTGSQGEPMSALTRISQAEHRQVGIVPGDTVIIAASPIPGNEKLVSRTVNNLFQLKANVIYRPVSGVHVSGHGSGEEIKLMINLLKPKYLIPVHGEFRQQAFCSQTAQKLGIPEDNVFLVKPGNVMEFNEGRGRLAGSVPAGRVLVDGFGVGDVGEVVIRDRQILSEDGIVIIVLAVDQDKGEVISGPEIITRGFVYVRESVDLLGEARTVLTRALDKMSAEQLHEWNKVKSKLRDVASSYFYEHTGRKPMIMPIIIDIQNKGDN
ncbi:MAG: ribonuclease J [Dethiobacteria bacterium]|nr:ribonuclease J [Bacillota bacterium]